MQAANLGSMKPIQARRTQPVKTSRKKLEVPEVLLTLSRSPVVKGWHAERLGKLARSFAPARLGIPSSAFLGRGVTSHQLVVRVPCRAIEIVLNALSTKEN